MKKFRLWLALALVLAGRTAFAESAGDPSPIDLVVLLDTSASMAEEYPAVAEFAIGRLLTDFLRIGDTFHLIGFAGAPKMEIAKKVEALGDIENIVSRLLLLYPLDPYTDIVSALEYAGRYLADLPDTRPKTVVIISDGENSPPPASPYGELSAAEADDRIAAVAARLKGNGWSFFYVKAPFPQSVAGPAVAESPSASAETAAAGASAAVTGQAPGRSNAVETPAAGTVPRAGAAPAEIPETGADSPEPGPAPSGSAETVATALAAPLIEWTDTAGADDLAAALGALVIEYPADIGLVDRRFALPLRVHNAAAQKVFIECDRVLVDGVDRLTRRAFLELAPRSDGVLIVRLAMPVDTAVGEHNVTIAPLFTGSLRPQPESAALRFALRADGFSTESSRILPIILLFLGLALALALALFIVFLVRRADRHPLASERRRAPLDSPATRSAGAPGGLLAAASGLSAAQLAADRLGAAKPAAGAPGGLLAAASGLSAAQLAADRLGAAKPAAGAPGGLLAAASGLSAAQLAADRLGAAKPAAGAPGGLLAAASGLSAAQLAADRLGAAKPAAGAPGGLLAAASGLSAAQLAADRLGAAKPAATIAAPLPATRKPDASSRRRHEKTLSLPPMAIRRPDTRILLSLNVENQNPNIGRRNTHLLRSGAQLSVGGGRSDFSVFLVPVPERLAYLRFDGENCSLYPRRPEFFPETGENPVMNCLDQAITIESERGYRMVLRFTRFEDPLIRLNRLLRSIEIPGY